VLVDVLEDDPQWADWSIQQLQFQSKIHRLVINPIVYSELSLTFSTSPRQASNEHTVAALNPVAQCQTHHRTAIETTPGAGVGIFNVRLREFQVGSFGQTDLALVTAPMHLTVHSQGQVILKAHAYQISLVSCSCKPVAMPVSLRLCSCSNGQFSILIKY